MSHGPLLTSGFSSDPFAQIRPESIRNVELECKRSKPIRDHEIRRGTALRRYRDNDGVTALSGEGPGCRSAIARCRPDRLRSVLTIRRQMLLRGLPACRTAQSSGGRLEGHAWRCTRSPRTHLQKAPFPLLAAQVVPTGGELCSHAPAQCRAVGDICEPGRWHNKAGEPAGVDPLPRDNREVAKPLDKATHRIACEVASTEKRLRSGWRIEATVSARTEPAGLVGLIVDPRGTDRCRP